MPPLQLTGGAGGAATAGGQNSASGGGGQDSSGWNVNFGGNQSVSPPPHQVAYTSGTYGLPVTASQPAGYVAASGANAPTPTVMLLLGLVALLLLRKARA